MFPTSLTPSGADSELGRRQIRDFLEQAVDELPETFRLVFILRDIEELSTEETAEQLSLKPETVKTRLHRRPPPAANGDRELAFRRHSPDCFRSTAYAATAAWLTGWSSRLRSGGAS